MSIIFNEHKLNNKYYDVPVHLELYFKFKFK